MREVIDNRTTPGKTWMDLEVPLPKVDGYIAVPDCDRIGQVWRLRPQGQLEWETFLVVDCAGQSDGGLNWMQSNRIIAEVDYATAVRWCTVGEWLPIEKLGYSRVRLVLPAWRAHPSINCRRYK